MAVGHATEHVTAAAPVPTEAGTVIEAATSMAAAIHPSGRLIPLPRACESVRRIREGFLACAASMSADGAPLGFPPFLWPSPGPTRARCPIWAAAGRSR